MNANFGQMPISKRATSGKVSTAADIAPVLHMALRYDS